MALISPGDINQLVVAMQKRSDSYFMYYLDELRVGLTAMNAAPGMATENKHRRATSNVITTLNVVHGNMKLSLCGVGVEAQLHLTDVWSDSSPSRFIPGERVISPSW
jgi:hypothetical protein